MGQGLLQNIKFLFPLTVPFFLSGCLMLNGVNPYKDKYALKPDQSRAIVVIAVGVEGIERSYNYPNVGIIFDEYDVVKHKITGNCWRYNNINISVKAIPQKIKYFIFDVPAGYYSYSGFNTAKIQTQENKSISFLAPAGQIVYVGDFIRTNNDQFKIQRNIDKAALELKKMYSVFNDKMVTAELLPISESDVFLCMP